MPKDRLLNGSSAILEAMDMCLAADPCVFVLGEGVADPKGIFGTTKGLVESYGPDRVIEMPVSENALTGVAIGAALMGQRPIMVHQRVDFALLSIEQIFNNAAKTHYVTQGQHKVPLVIRMIIGRGWGQGASHSQSLEAVFAHIPGLKVVMPSTPREAKGMLIAAVDDDNPVIVLEHRWIHYATGPVPEGRYSTPLSGPARIRQGKDLTIVASSYMLFETLQAAEALQSVGIEADVFDLRVLRPLSLDPVIDSVRRTGNLIIVDTGWRTYGAGAEIASCVVESCFSELKAPPVRIGLKDHPTPSSPALVGSYYPTSVTILDTAVALAASATTDAGPARDRLLREREQVPLDIPHPAFRGPF